MKPQFNPRRARNPFGWFMASMDTTAVYSGFNRVMLRRRRRAPSGFKIRSTRRE
jgi:hypothetical protein